MGYQIVKADGGVISTDKVCRAGCFVTLEDAKNYLQRMRAYHPRTEMWKNAIIKEVE